MNEIQRKALYSLASAISGVLVAYGVYTASTGDTLLGVIQAIIAVVPTVTGVIAHRHVPAIPGSGEPTPPEV